MVSFENEDGGRLILGVDILPGSSAFSRARYAVVLLRESEIVDRYPDIGKRKLLRLIIGLSPDYVASDNIFELVDDSRNLRALCAGFPPKTKLIQVTGSPYHGFKPLREISRIFNISFSGKPNPMQTAVIVARLVDLGVGFIVEPFTDETKIGVDWDQIIKVPNKTATGKVPDIQVSQKFDTGASSGITFQSSKKNFILNMLQTVGDVNVLSSPRILTFDNKEASINIGKKVAFIRFFRNLLGWERKPRVWPGQAVPQRSIFAPLMAVFRWRKHQIFMLALARLRWPK